MKSRRFLSAFLCAVLALTLLTPAALANSWGLKSGMILNAVSKTHDYDEYTALAQLKLPDGEVAVMASRYHAVLLYAYKSNGKTRLDMYHTAVKQRSVAAISAVWSEWLFTGKRQNRRIDLASGQPEHRADHLADVQRW